MEQPSEDPNVSSASPTTQDTLPRHLDDVEVSRLRADFPILGRSVNGVPLTYLDSGATSQKPSCVYEAEQHFYENFNAAVHRGAHSLAVEATDIFEQARTDVAGFIGAKDNEVVWTSNAT